MTDNEITETIIGCAYSVANELGLGFLEKVYERAMMIAISEKKLKVENQVPVSVFYHGNNVGDYFADLLVEDKIIIELKSVQELMPIHKTQLLNYLKATNKRIGLLINFGPAKVDVKRIINGF